LVALNSLASVLSHVLHSIQACLLFVDANADGWVTNALNNFSYPKGFLSRTQSNPEFALKTRPANKLLKTTASNSIDFLTQCGADCENIPCLDYLQGSTSARDSIRNCGTFSWCTQTHIFSWAEHHHLLLARHGTIRLCQIVQQFIVLYAYWGAFVTWHNRRKHVACKQRLYI